MNVPTLSLHAVASKHVQQKVCEQSGDKSLLCCNYGTAGIATATAAAAMVQIPLDGQVRQQSDAGVPVVMSAPDSLSGQAYIDIAGKIKAQLSSSPCATVAKQPTITID